MFTTVPIIILLVLASSSQFVISSSFATSPSNMGREAEALLEWKASLENHSQLASFGCLHGLETSLANGLEFLATTLAASLISTS